MRIFRPAHRLALTLILTVLLGACGGGGNYAELGAADGASADPNVPTRRQRQPCRSVPTVPTVVDPVTTVIADNGLAQFVMSLPADGQFDVGKVLRISCGRRRLEDHPGAAGRKSRWSR